MKLRSERGDPKCPVQKIGFPITITAEVPITRKLMKAFVIENVIIGAPAG